MLTYTSTRGGGEAVTAAQAILSGMAPDGGLYMPERIPVLALPGPGDSGYASLAGRLIAPFFSGYSSGEAERIAAAAYHDTFSAAEVTPLVGVGDAYVLELFHGPTAAFKDMALSFLPGALSTARDRFLPGVGLLILAATSGDTGSAAMAGFCDMPGIGVIVFYPEEGISPVQKAQMLTIPGHNLEAVGIRGNFDDAQAGVKRILGGVEGLTDAAIRLSSANSINVGRLLPQMPYYFEAYRRLVETGAVRAGERVDFAVPSGNFGDILAGYLAGLAGLPVGRLLCATNANSVLCDFFHTGVYDRRRPLRNTLSPSMDILVSGNLERLLFLASGRDPGRVAELMSRLSQQGWYAVEDDMRKAIRDSFVGASVSDEETLATIGKVYREYGYLLDPHTATGWKAMEDHRASGEAGRATVVLATASPFKFPLTVLRALGEDPKDSAALPDRLSDRTGIPVPTALEGIGRKKPLRHSIVDRDAMAGFVAQSARRLVWSR